MYFRPSDPDGPSLLDRPPVPNPLPFSRILSCQSHVLSAHSEEHILNSVRIVYKLRHGSELEVVVRARSVEERDDAGLRKLMEGAGGGERLAMVRSLLELGGVNYEMTFASRMERELNSFNELMLRRDPRGLIKVHRNFERPAGELEGLFESMAMVGKSSFSFEVCPTYPESVLLPEVSIQQLGFLDKVKDFRVKARIPALVYMHRRKGVCTSLWRSGQIRKGLFTRWSAEDKELIGDIGRLFSGDAAMECHEPRKTHIFDCRPFINAFGNKLMGKGYITASKYDIEECVFGGIENIHVMRKDFEAVKGEARAREEGKAVGVWAGHLRGILVGTGYIQEKLSSGRSVLVNCSDGWDRTPQIVSLAKLLLDPYYRTFEGFRSLLYVDWISFGHKFATRQDVLHNQESSPIFIQYLDCVHQIMSVLPEKFEFTGKLLTSLYRAYCDNCYEEFVYDSTEEYLNHNAEEISWGRSYAKPGLCVWDILENTKALYLNPNYEFADFDGKKEGKMITEYFEERAKGGCDDGLNIQPKEMKIKLWSVYV